MKLLTARPRKISDYNVPLLLTESQKRLSVHQQPVSKHLVVQPVILILAATVLVGAGEGPRGAHSELQQQTVDEFQLQPDAA